MTSISPKMLREIRKRRGLSLEELSKNSGVEKGTINRIELGKSRSNRQTTIGRLAKALGVKPHQLTSDDVEALEQAGRDPQSSQAGIVMSHDARNALTLVAAHYGIKPEDIVHLAPFLFLAVAEQSLTRRRQQVELLQEQWAAIKEASSHLHPVVLYNGRGEDVLDDELRSIHMRDIFGTKLDAESVPQDYEESEHNPIAVHLAEIAEATGGLVSFEHWSPHWSGPGYTVSSELAAPLVGGDMEAAEQIVRGYAPLHELPKDVRSGGATAVAEWAKQRGDEVLAEFEAMLASIIDGGENG